MSGEPLKLLSSMATRELLGELVAAYQRDSGAAVSTEAAGGVDVANRVQGGEAVDVVVLSAQAIDKLIAAGRIVAGSRVDLVKSGIAAAVRAGAPRPDIASEAALRRAVQRAQSLSYSTGPSGVHLEKVFEHWGILGEVRPRIVVPPPGTPVATLVAKGQVELGFQQLAELRNVPGIDILGMLPPPAQTITTFSGGVASASRDPEAARRLLDYLAAPATAEAKRRHGMDPA